jgi:hypothetical protein
MTLVSILLLSFTGEAQELRSPESIVWDDYSERYLVSNTVDASIRAVNSRGLVSEISAKGSHGLLLKDDVLFACYRDEIKIYDVRSDILIGSFAVNGAKFLNGICEDDRGYLYATDFSNRSIYRLHLGSDNRAIDRADQWLSLDAIPNGIAYDGLRDELVVVTWGSKGMIYCIDRQTASIEHEVESGFGNLESILINKQGDAYISCWTPSAILKFEQGVRTSPVVWKSDNIFRPTGLVLDKNSELVYVSADAGSISGFDSKSGLSSDLVLEAFPNPVSVNSLISYEIEDSGYVNISVYDCRGNLVQTLVTEEKRAGAHQFMYERDDRSSGLYFINIQSEGSSQAIAVTLVD